MGFGELGSHSEMFGEVAVGAGVFRCCVFEVAGVTSSLGLF